jgi:muconolactone delta-isomerase
VHRWHPQASHYRAFKRTLDLQAQLEFATMLFLVVSTPRPEKPSELVQARQSFWPWIAGYQARGVCRHIYARVGRGAVAVFDVEDNDAIHRVLNEWADIIPAHFDTYPLIDVEAAKQMLAAQVAAKV